MRTVPAKFPRVEEMMGNKRAGEVHVVASVCAGTSGLSISGRWRRISSSLSWLEAMAQSAKRQRQGITPRKVHMRTVATLTGLPQSFVIHLETAGAPPSPAMMVWA